MTSSSRSANSALLARARQGSDEALGELLDACGRRLLALIRLRLQGSPRLDVESRDVLQATFLKALEHFDGFAGSGSRTLVAWLAAIARNEIRDRAEYGKRQRRDARLRVPLSTGIAAPALAGPISRIQLARDERRLEEALGELPEEHREVILLRRFEELGFREIGERMDRSEDAARMLYARALAALTVRMRGSRR